MDDLKWLKRKYPDSFDELNVYFDRKELRDFKKSTHKIGRLIKDVTWCQKYNKGTILQFKRSNPINNYNYPFVYCVVKCDIGYTESGYHFFTIREEDFIELTT